MPSENRFREARDRGGEYLVKQLRPDGSFGLAERGLADYCKVAVALQVCGASAEANRFCNWIRKCAIFANGDFGPRPQEANGYWYIYYNAWIIMGGHRQGHFDISQKAISFIMEFWDGESGGFYSSVNPPERRPETLQDIWVTCGAGIAALYTGHIEVARGVGKWLKSVMDQQPNFPQELYSVYSRAVGLHTQFNPEEAIRYVSIYNPSDDGYFFNSGISSGFLSALYKATGEAEWLNLAKKYLGQAEIANDFFLRSLRAGKVGWAASVLYTLTNERQYQELAARVGNNLVEIQNPDGSWTSHKGAEYTNDVTAEMTVWLDEIYQALGKC